MNGSFLGSVFLPDVDHDFGHLNNQSVGEHSVHNVHMVLFGINFMLTKFREKLKFLIRKNFFKLKSGLKSVSVLHAHVLDVLLFESFGLPLADLGPEIISLIDILSLPWAGLLDQREERVAG